MSGDQLFDDAELFTGNPLDPDLDNPCPPQIIATLTLPQREQRVEKLIEQAHYIIDRAWELADGRQRAAWAVLFSGGGDSTVLFHLMRHRIDITMHANTTVGIEATRQFVRDTSAAYGIDLIERRAPQTYRELITEVQDKTGLPRGMPGPAMHFFYYGRLKERALDEARREIVTHNRRQSMLYIAGRRRLESDRRSNVPLWERDGSAVWASPMANWSKLDINTYILMMAKRGDPVPVNEVGKLLHMSGECLCGCFAKPGELEEIRIWYPDTAAELEAHEAALRALGVPEPYATWGHGTPGKKLPKVGRMCSSCAPPPVLQPGMLRLEIGA